MSPEMNLVCALPYSFCRPSEDLTLHFLPLMIAWFLSILLVRLLTTVVPAERGPWMLLLLTLLRPHVAQQGSRGSKPYDSIEGYPRPYDSLDDSSILHGPASAPYDTLVVDGIEKYDSLEASSFSYVVQESVRSALSALSARPSVW